MLCGLSYTPTFYACVVVVGVLGSGFVVRLGHLPGCYASLFCLVYFKWPLEAVVCGPVVCLMCLRALLVVIWLFRTLVLKDLNI